MNTRNRIGITATVLGVALAALMSPPVIAASTGYQTGQGDNWLNGCWTGYSVNGVAAGAWEQLACLGDIGARAKYEYNGHIYYSGTTKWDPYYVTYNDPGMNYMAIKVYH